MATETGKHLAEIIRATLAELKKTCADVDEATAGRAPAGRWSPKEILSHLMGPGEGRLLALFGRFTAEDDPLIEIVPEQTHYTAERQGMRFEQMLREVERRYEEIAVYALGLSEEQFARRARIPLFKETPLTDHPPLATVIGGMGQYHVQMHIDHLRQVLAELAAK